MKASTVDMDFNFLKTVQKSHESGRHHIEKLEKRGESSKKKKVAQAKRRKALANALERGCKVEVLPKWMERSERNKTTWDSEYCSYYLGID
jgi:hypothetical protein